MTVCCTARVSSHRIFSHSAAFQAARQTSVFRWQHALYSSSSENDNDAGFMDLAIQHARKGLGGTFPNPAVGCVLVRQDTNDVLGAGFHPRAGFPHAEVFALLQASGHVESGVDAAISIVNDEDTSQLYKTVVDLTNRYASPDDDGPETLFGQVFESTPVTAYVTLEPCCHFGKTPPCAASLVLSQVDRVVVGFRDPNPRVDGGGVKLLEEAGIQVDYARGIQAVECAKLVEYFVKRISPRDTNYENITGGMRRALRSLAGRLKNENKLAIRTWPSSGPSVDATSGDSMMNQVNELPLNPCWMEDLDACLWQKELVQLRLGNAVAKKKGAKRLGERIATELDAHVAQVVGHTVLLYRPGIPPVLDLQKLVEERQTSGDDDDE